MAESGTLEGRVKDSQGEPLPFLNIVLFKDESVVSECSTDFDSQYKITGMTPDGYELKAELTGYATYRNPSVNIGANKITYPDITMQQGIETNL